MHIAEMASSIRGKPVTSLLAVLVIAALIVPGVAMVSLMLMKLVMMVTLIH